VRRLIALAATIFATFACASASPPPGGPEDHAPPKLVRVTPDTNAVNVRDDAVSFYFDETINDRGSGAQEVGNYFLVSPSDGAPHVSWHRSRIDVRPRNGFRPNTAYTVTLLPGLSDLRNNPMRAGAAVVFATGPTIPTGRITGVAFDWAAERPAARAFMQALTPDSVTYLAQADSLGHFTIGPLAPGSYLVRAVIDQNGNRALDRNEPYDSATVVVPQAAPIELRTAVRDTLPPRMLSVTSSDSLSLLVTFDRLVDPTYAFAPDSFRLVAADSTVVPITRVLTPRELERESQARQQATADSARRVDSLAGKVIPPRTTPPTRPAGSTPSVPPPFTTLTLRVQHPLAPNATYRLSLRSARGLTGRMTASERSFTTPRPPPPPAPRSAADSARAPARVPARPTTATPPSRP
jgi:hypothetical protein